MNKQSYISAVIVLGLSVASLFAGYWLGYEDRQELVQAIIRNIEREQQNNAAETRDSLRMLVALKEGRKEIVVDLLTSKVKSGLRLTQPIGHEVVDYLSSISEPSKATLQEAIEYQNKYCSDQCLGL